MQPFAPEGEMTKGKRRRKREQRRQAAKECHKNGVSVGAVLTKAVRNSVEEGNAQAAENETEGDVQMPTKTGVSEWIRENANSVIALFTIVIAVVAGIQACIYKSQLDWTRIEERAWLAVKFTPFNGPVVNATLPAPLVIGNTGKTVATKIKGWIFFRPVPIGATIDVSEFTKVSPSSLPEGEPIPAWTKFDTGVIFPNDSIPMLQPVFAKTPAGKRTPQPATWDQTLQDQWLRGDIYLALNGKVTYDDASGTHHWTTFCTFFMAPGTGKNVSIDTSDRCTSYNSVDNNK